MAILTVCDICGAKSHATITFPFGIGTPKTTIDGKSADLCKEHHAAVLIRGAEAIRAIIRDLADNQKA